MIIRSQENLAFIIYYLFINIFMLLIFDVIIQLILNKKFHIFVYLRIYEKLYLLCNRLEL